MGIAANFSIHFITLWAKKFFFTISRATPGNSDSKKYLTFTTGIWVIGMTRVWDSQQARFGVLSELLTIFSLSTNSVWRPRSFYLVSRLSFDPVLFELLWTKNQRRMNNYQKWIKSRCHSQNWSALICHWLTIFLFLISEHNVPSLVIPKTGSDKNSRIIANKKIWLILRFKFGMCQNWKKIHITGQSFLYT